MTAPSPGLLETMRSISAVLQAGDYRTAHERLEAVVALQPAFAEGLRLLGGCKQALGDLAGAEALLRRALAADPRWTPTLATLGELLLASGRADEAVPLLRDAAAGNPPSARAAFVLARWFNDNRRPADALAVAAPLCERGAADADLASQHVAALAALGRLDEAVALYRRLASSAVSGNAATASTASSVATANAATSAPGAATSSAGAATPSSSTATSRGAVVALHALAVAFDAAGRPADAEQAARRAIASGLRAPATFLTLARSLVARGDFAQAEQALRDSLRLEPRGVDAHAMLARLVWMRSGDAAAATAAMDEALKRFAADDALLAAKAAVLQGAGDARGAYACLADRAAQPQAPPALLIRAGLAALEFEPATALQFAERALQAMSGNAPALNLMTAAELGVGDARRALEHCKALLASAPDDQYLIALQTTCWRLLGDPRYGEMCDYARLAVPFHLQAPPGWSSVAAFFADLSRSLDRLHNPHGHPLLFQSLRNGTETTDDLARSTDPVIQALFRSFDEPIREYMARIGRGDDALRRRNRGSYRFNGGWSVRLRSSGFHNSHVHPRGWISSACYIELPDFEIDATGHALREPTADGTDCAGALVFGQPSLITTPPLGNEHVIRPEVGMLVLFPSYFWHGTVPFVSARTRLTVAFDMVPGT